MIIELTGLPGAGKTTSEPHIISCFEQRGFRVLLRSELKTKIKNECLLQNANKPLALRIHSNRLSNLIGLLDVGLGVRFFREFFFKKRRMVFLWLGEDIRTSAYFLKNYLPYDIPPSVYIPSEGFVHHCACIKVWTGGGFTDLPEKLLQKFTSEKFNILYFKISVDEALDRVLKRGIPEMWPSHINSGPRVKEILHRFNEAIESNVQKFQDNGVNVQTIDASLDLHAMESRVREVCDNQIKNGILGETEEMEKLPESDQSA